MPLDQRCLDCARYGVDCDGENLDESYGDELPCFVINQEKAKERDPEREAEEAAERKRRYWENRDPVTSEELW